MWRDFFRFFAAKHGTSAKIGPPLLLAAQAGQSSALLLFSGFCCSSKFTAGQHLAVFQLF